MDVTTTASPTVIENVANLTTLSVEVVQNIMVAGAAVVATLFVVWAIRKIKRSKRAYR
jgi:hypothetical protein